MSHFTVLVNAENPEFVESRVDEILAPFDEQTDNPEFLTFVDCTSEIEKEYAQGGIDCFKSPDGRFLHRFHPEVTCFCISENKVFERCAGPLKHRKRTKKAKRYKALPDYPYKKLFSSETEFAEKWKAYAYCEKEGAYGYYTNENSFWDWYQIGGRWPFEFLVKADCKSAYTGERSWATREADMPFAPEGYIWVPAAAKRDIAWDLMKKMAIEGACKNYEQFKEWFDTKQLPGNLPLCDITPEGIKSWGNMLYYKDETLDDFLARNNLSPDCKYPVSFYGYIENEEYYSVGDMGWWGISSNERDENKWRDMLQTYIDNVPDDNVLVVVDCHV